MLVIKDKTKNKFIEIGNIVQPLKNDLTQVEAGKYALDAAQGYKLNGDIANCESAITKVGNNVETLKKMAKGILYEYQTDSTEAYSKAIPAGAKVMDLNMVQSGKSFVKNQMIYVSVNKTYTGAGITFVSDNNGNIVLNGTATSNYTINSVFLAQDNFVAGHKYYLRGCASGGSTSTYCLRYNNNGFAETGSGVIVTCIASGSGSGGTNQCVEGYKIAIFVKQDTVLKNITFTPQIFDLTTMFGSGNEPSTVAEFEAMFPNDYYEYTEPTLTTVNAQQVVVKGKNLFNQNDFRDTTKWTTNNNGQPLYKLDVVNGLSYTFNYTNLTSITNTFLYLYKYPRGNKTDYTRVSYVLADSTIVKNIKFTAEDYDYYLWAYNTISQATAISIMDNIQLELGTTATAYTPYKAPTTITLPTTIATGKSAGSVYDSNEFYSTEVDGVTKYYCKHTQRVGSVVFDGVNYKFTGASGATANGYGAYATKLPFNHFAAAISDKFTYSTQSRVDMPLYSFVGRNGADNTIYFILPSTITSVEDANAWLVSNPTTIYYELATPIETVTELSQNLFEALTVEGGGSITFVGNNENYHIPMANEEEYLVYLNEV